MTLANNQTRKLVTIGVLSALGAVLMILEIPYPFVTFLTFDLSDVVVLIIFALYGWKEAAAVGILKALVHMLAKGPVMGPIAIPIGQITAFFASMSYVFAMYLTADRFKLNKYVSAVVAVFIVTIIMTVLNYFFITPIYVGYWWYSLIPFSLSPQDYGFDLAGGYLVTILVVYIPFNLLKAGLITSAFIVIFEALRKANPEYMTFFNEKDPK